MPATGTLFDLTGKSAIITGSTRGIGKAIAEQLANHGCKVAISSRKPGPCEEVAAEINKTYGAGMAIASPANISSKDDLQKLVDDANAAFGKIDILVCNAASNPYYGPMSGISDEAFAKILSNNIISNNTLVSLVSPQMKQRKDGAVIIISSIGGLRASTVIGAYCVSKAADVQLARNLAAELGPSGIRVNCISPGLVKTDFAKALWEDDNTREQREEETPMRRLGEPNDIAGAAVMLASRAGAWLTGQNIVVDGGVTAV
jgi:NAD(P)-dependent dehydrogenase (short-subunit alcohol dehydrogenase family)